MSDDRTLQFNDKSIASMSGTSQALLPVNPFRRYLLIQNTGNANVGVNIAGGTAVLGGTGTITLVPNGSYEPDSGVMPCNAMTVIGTAGQPVVCIEG